MLQRQLLLAGVLALGAAPAPGADPERDRPPVPLHIPALVAPIETAGSGLGPEVSVRLRVDTAGRPMAIEVTRIEPSSRHDDLFRRDARKSLLRCRFAPALRGGVPVEAEIPLTVRYAPHTSDSWAEPDPLTLGLSGGELREAEVRGTLMLPADSRQHLLELKTRRALKHFRTAPIPHDTGRFRLYVGAQHREFAVAIGRNLESLFGFLDAGFRPALEPLPDNRPFIVLVFDSMAEYKAMATSFSSDLDMTQGFYSPEGLFAFHRQVVTDESLLGTLLHEATHAYLDRHVIRPGVSIPTWLGEGYATYIGNSAVRDGVLRLGELRSKDNYRFDFGRIRTRSETLFQIDEAKRALRGKDGASLASILSADPDTFYDDQQVPYYPLSWLAVHFLHHGRPDWTTRRFSEFLLYVAEGFAVDDALRASYGSPESLEKEFRKYVRGL